MSELEARLKAVEADLGGAIETLRGVLGHVQATRPEPALRVVLLNNVLVALISMIEEVLRNLFSEYLGILEDEVETYDGLRTELRKANLECAIGQLREHSKNLDTRQSATIVAELGRYLNGEKGYRLLKDDLTNNKGNFRSKQLTDTANSAGVSKIWNKICDCSDIESLTGESALDARVTKLISTWNALFDERDLIVHRYSQANGWGPERIDDALKFCQLIVRRVADCLVGDATEIMRVRDTRAARLSE